MPDPEDQNWGKFASAGLEVAVGVGLGCLVGWWLDRRFGWSPVGLIVGAMLGLAAGMYLFISDVMKMNR